MFEPVTVTVHLKDVNVVREAIEDQRWADANRYAKLIGLLQTPSYHCALPVDFADSLPRAPPSRGQTPLPSSSG